MPEKSITDFKSVKALGHAVRLKEVIAHVVNVCRPYNQNPRDLEYGWHRQLIKLEDDNGEVLALIIYTDKMHLSSENEGQVWRFRSLNSENGARGLEVNKWIPRGSQEVNFELKLNSWGDACRLPYLEKDKGMPAGSSSPATQEDQDDPSIQIHSPEAMPEALEDTPGSAESSGEIEELVVAMIRSRRDHGREKYGTSMERTDLTLRNWLQHRLEELCDDAAYTMKCIQMIDSGELHLLPKGELARLQGAACEVPAFTKPKPETDARIREMNDQAERQLAERRGDDQRQRIEDAEVDERNAERGLSTAPVTKPGRDSKHPQGHDPFADRRDNSQPEQSHEAEMIERAEDLQFIAMEVRWAYDESATEDQVRKANDAMLLRKKKGYSWEVVFDALTGPARARHGEGKFIDAAVATLRANGDRQRAGRNEDPLTDEQMYEGLCKYPKALRTAVEAEKAR